ncbi:ATG4A [Bugula neritina]|uniref:ATG4A n=1 Tax=Bugula neritina TaxID=10212 RepID=A0A7J7KTT6_BUGNE|nr:ATG4A [Bugula neritina]
MAELGFVMGGLSYTYENGVTSTDPFPPSNDPVIILGKKYSSVFDHKKLKKVVQTLPWFTYRKGFNPIGGTGMIHVAPRQTKAGAACYAVAR